MERIKFTVASIIYRNQDNGYSVLSVSRSPDSSGNVASSFLSEFSKYETIVGTFHEINVGTTLLVEGDWRDDKRYGRQFVVDSWTDEMPSTIKGIENYLASGMISGIGKSMAHRIVKQFGLDTIDVLDNDIERLREVSGIGRERLDKIRTSWERQRGIKDVMVFLQGHGVSAAYATRIYKQYGLESIQRVKENPYCLASDVVGIGFKMADEIASHLGYGKNDPRRCKAGIVYTLEQLAKDGHCFAEMVQLVSSAKILLEASEQPVTDAINALLFEQGIIEDDGCIFLPMYYYSEVNVAEKMKGMLKTVDKSISLDDLDMDDVSEISGIEYDDIQKDAIREAVRSKVMVLTGGPGTGKTTTTLGIIAALESFGKEIILAAPTGRAAKRMSEATGKESMTIHRLLEFNPNGGFLRNEEYPLDGDVLIVDESSMIDISLMSSLMKAVPKSMRLVIVGDIDQLPSVGAGNVLMDIIDSGVVPVVRLTRIFRQAQRSRIVTNAHRINRGEFPDLSNGMASDFFFIKEDDQERAAHEIVNIVNCRIPNAYNYSTNDIQVLVPMTKGAAGTKNLNIMLQNAINPVGECITSGSNIYRVGDRVMQIKNNYNKNVFNGDIGFIDSVDSDERTMLVDFDGNLVEYESGDFGELTLSYATTIHKSQGSEYPVVIVPLLMSHFIMLQRNLLYTAVTRAKRLCILIGDNKAVACAVRNMSVLKRNTRLKERLQK